MYKKNIVIVLSYKLKITNIQRNILCKSTSIYKIYKVNYSHIEQLYFDFLD